MRLEIDNLKVSYGLCFALKGFSLRVEDGQAVAVLGPNGAGKTTLLRTISGFPQTASRALDMERKEGEIRLNKVRIENKRPSEIVRLGISHVPEGREVFPYLTVEENLTMGSYAARSFRPDGALTRIYDYFPLLSERKKSRAETLSGGEQQMLAIGRALMARPRLLLLDEPSLGLAPNLVRQIFDILLTIRTEEGITTLIVEQNAHMALELAEYAYVLENGRGVLSGTCEELRNNETVREFYLGLHEEEGRRNYADARTYRRHKHWR
jgi:branched-chain amino acid transport system ATP-binding protein